MPDRHAGPDQRGARRWVPFVVALIVFLLTAVENASYWWLVARRAFLGTAAPTDPGLGLFALAAALIPIAAAVLAWRLRPRRRPSDPLRRLTMALWVASIVSLLPLVIAAFVPGV
jgi:hypothetical protein